MKLTDLEIKLITLALNGAARGGEIGNAAEKLFNSFRARGVKPEEISLQKSLVSDPRDSTAATGNFGCPRRGTPTPTWADLMNKVKRLERELSVWQDLAEARLNVGESLAKSAIEAHEQFHGQELIRAKEENARLQRQYERYVAPKVIWENIQGWAMLIVFALTCYGCAHGFR